MKEEADDDCVLPPDQPIPSAELHKYTLGSDPHDEAEVARYVDGQCHGDETVQHVELMKTEFVGGQRFDAWDVHTDKQRWWVLSNITNLYPQAYFTSLDYTLSLHIGLMLRIQAREAHAGGGDPSPFEEVYRRQNQASDLIDRAIEAEEFQAVGMQLRECMISLTTALRRLVDLEIKGERPKENDAKGWLDLLVSHFCPGSSNEDLRSYLKSAGDKTWRLVNRLTHDRDANRTSTRITFDAVAALIGHHSWLIMRDRDDLTEVCPNCSSRNVRSYFDPHADPDGGYFDGCRACGWSNQADIVIDGGTF